MANYEIIGAGQDTARPAPKTNTITCGDCLEVMQGIPDKNVDMVLCDLPYGTTACKWDIVIPFEALWKEYYRVVRPNGFMVLTASQPFTTKLINSNIDNYSHQWIWKKEQGANPLLANIAPMKNFEDILVFGNEIGKANNSHIIFAELKAYLNAEKKKTGMTSKEFNYLFSEYFKKQGKKDRSVIEHYWQNIQFMIPTKEIYENILQKTGFFNRSYSYIESFNPPRIYNPQKTKGKKYKSGGGFIECFGQEVTGGNISDERFPTAIIEFNTDKSNSFHPTQKPVALFEYLIRTYTNEGDTVLDNCIGSGTTAIACINTGRNYIGIEKEEKYCRIAEKRIHALRSPAQNAMEICHTAPNTRSLKNAQLAMDL